MRRQNVTVAALDKLIADATVIRGALLFVDDGRLVVLIGKICATTAPLQIDVETMIDDVK